MAEKILKTISAEDDPMYEIVEPSGKPFNVIIRSAENKDKSFELPKSVLHMLGTMLIKIYNEYDEELRTRK